MPVADEHCLKLECVGNLLDAPKESSQTKLVIACLSNSQVEISTEMTTSAQEINCGTQAHRDAEY